MSNVDPRNVAWDLLFALTDHEFPSPEGVPGPHLPPPAAEEDDEGPSSNAASAAASCSSMGLRPCVSLDSLRSDFGMYRRSDSCPISSRGFAPGGTAGVDVSSLSADSISARVTTGSTRCVPALAPVSGSMQGSNQGYNNQHNMTVSTNASTTDRNMPGKTTSHGRPQRLCCADGCKAELSQLKEYFRRRKLCEECINSREIQYCGQSMRFCQQCSKLHPVAEFDGPKRSCRKRLEKHRLAVSRRGLAGASSAAGTRKPSNQSA
mmetsp:Transcript_28747/g.80946  ORF Transcript_28747/g.80946 Transcript_28747/m.80946 type:complete len:264 (-) Transcript_28747:673-1464(-)